MPIDQSVTTFHNKTIPGNLNTITDLPSTAYANNSVTNTALADMAPGRFKARRTGTGTGDPEDITASQATAELNAFVGDSGAGGTKGLVPAPSAGFAAAGKVLGASGSFVFPASDFFGNEVANDSISPNDTISIAAGWCLSDDGTTFMESGAVTKTTATFAAGSGNGGMSSGSAPVATNTGYHLFRIKNPSTGAVDHILDVSATAPTLPSGYTKKRWLWWVATRAAGSTSLRPFLQAGNTNWWTNVGATVGVAALQYSTAWNANHLTSALTLVAFVVLAGIRVAAIIEGYMTDAAARSFLITSPWEASGVSNVPDRHITAANPAGGFHMFSGEWITNFSQQLQFAATGGTIATIQGVCRGWRVP
jgi:hypothetical protein